MLKQKIAVNKRYVENFQWSATSQVHRPRSAAEKRGRRGKYKREVRPPDASLGSISVSLTLTELLVVVVAEARVVGLALKFKRDAHVLGFCF